jgi:hypothetical protein
MLIIGRSYFGTPVSFQIDAQPVESDVVAAAEAAIGGAAGNSATSAAGAVTFNNAVSGTVTTEALTTATGATYTLTITSNLIKVNSVVLANVTLGTATHGTLQIVHITPAAGSVAILIKNIDGTNAVNGTLKVGFAIFQ